MRRLSVTAIISKVKQRLYERRGPILAGLVLLLAPLIIFFDVLFLKTRTFFVGLDNIHQFYAWAQKLTISIHQGTLPFWDANVMGGKSFIGEFQPGVLYPINWIWSWLFGSSAGISEASLNGLVVFHFFIASIAVYWLARLLGVSRAGAIIAGLIFAYTGSVLGRSTSQISIFYGLSLLPLAVALIVKSLKAITTKLYVVYSLLSGAALGLIVLAGHLQPFTHAAMLVGAILIGFAIYKHKLTVEGFRFILKRSLLVLGAFFVVGGLQFAVGYSWLNNAYRLGNEGYATVEHKASLGAFAKSYILHPEELTNLVIPGHITEGASIYFGIFALLILIFGTLLTIRHKLTMKEKKEQKDGRFLRKVIYGTGIFGFIVALGMYTPVIIGIYIVPMLSGLVRAPIRYLILTQLAVAIAIGVSVAIVQARASKIGKTVALQRIIAGVVLVTGVLYGAYIYLLDDMILSPWLGIGVALAGVGFAGLIVLPRKFGLGLAVIVVILGCYISTKSYVQRVPPEKRAEVIYAETDVVKFIQTLSYSKYRVVVAEDALPVNIGDVYNVQTRGGYGATLYAPYFRFVQQNPEIPGVSDGLEGPENSYLGVKYLVAHSELPQYKKLFQGKDGAKVYDMGDAAPKLISKDRFDRGDFINNPIDFTVIEYQEQRQIYKISMDEAGDIVSPDVMAPGWTAKLDGKRIEMSAFGPSLRPERLFRSVSVPVGEHTLEFSYNLLESL